MIEKPDGKSVSIKVDGEIFSVPERITIKKALELSGSKPCGYPGGGDMFAPCGTGGCWSCAVLVDGEIEPCCVTAVREGMDINTRADVIPKRPVHGWIGHAVGGVGTPWQLKRSYGFIEAAMLMTDARKTYKVDRMAISGGECTLNRKWLVQYLQELKKRNPDKNARFHVDTNGSILTGDYLDEQVEAGMTDIGIDLKSLELDTFSRMTGVDDKDLARKYLDTAWNAVKYLIDNYLLEEASLPTGMR
jgi:pyruvate formate lyase activating enzyme